MLRYDEQGGGGGEEGRRGCPDKGDGGGAGAQGEAVIGLIGCSEVSKTC